MSSPIGLVVGLGNPGPRYEATRHNAGFWFVDRLAERLRGEFRANNRFHGETCEIGLAGQSLRLLKPLTYMNRSGQAVLAVAHFYRYPPESILVVHDEVDLPPGVVRVKQGGGHGGHNGLRDIVARLGSAAFARVRIGVGHPGHSAAVADYVLTRAPAGEQSLIDESIERALDLAPRLVAGELGAVMNSLHRKPDREAGGERDPS